MPPRKYWCKGCDRLSLDREQGVRRAVAKVEQPRRLRQDGDAQRLTRRPDFIRRGDHHLLLEAAAAERQAQVGGGECTRARWKAQTRRVGGKRIVQDLRFGWCAAYRSRAGIELQTRR